LNDTAHHRMVQLDDLSGQGRVIFRSELAHHKLFRPHDQIVDPVTHEVYMIDGNRRLFRFRDLEGLAEVWTFAPSEMGYARALSWFDGHLHVIDSSRGEVVRIDDYSRRHFTTFRSPRPASMHGILADMPKSRVYHDYPAGALSTTGLVLNDVDKDGDWYYGSNYFTPPYASGADTGPARLIRWRTWADFEQGRWQDLSAYIPPADIPLMPYFLTIHDHVLYTGVGISNMPQYRCKQDQLLALNLGSLPQMTQVAR
jgi:hypothetical protein